MPNINITNQTGHMDWYSWLSKTGLDPLLLYHYGRIFSHNELEEEDVTYFNHEFLQSMGISVAKHRLEILKLAKKQAREGATPNSPSRLISAISKTKSIFNEKIGKWAFHKSLGRIALSNLGPCGSPRSRALRKVENNSNNSPNNGRKQEVMFAKPGSNVLMRSGPLERVEKEESLMLTNTRTVSVSGPLDSRVQEGLMSTNCSPRVYVPRRKESPVFPKRIPKVSRVMDGRSPSPKVERHYKIQETMVADDELLPSFWSVMFQDIKPV